MEYLWAFPVFLFLRDDIIFVIYLFQRWKYPTDMTRPNEYGQVFEQKEDQKDDQKDDSTISADGKGDKAHKSPKSAKPPRSPKTPKSLADKKKD